MRGWDPERQAREERIEVVETTELPDRVLACVDPERRIIWVAAGLSPAHRRCAVAYELGELHQGPTPTDPRLARVHQRDAVDWAAQMLIDGDDLIDAFARAPRYADVAELLDVDVPTLRARLRGMTDAEQDRVLEAIHSLRLSA